MSPPPHRSAGGKTEAAAEAPGALPELAAPHALPADAARALDTDGYAVVRGLASPQEVFKRAAVVYPRTSGQRHFLAHAALHLLDEAAEVSLANVRRDSYPALTVLAADLVRSFADGDLRDGPKRHERWRTGSHGEPIERSDSGGVAVLRRKRNRQILQRGDVGADVLRQAYHQGEAPVALEDHPGLASADGDGDHLLRICCGKTEPARCFAIDVDVHDRQSFSLFHIHVCRSGNLTHDSGDLVGGLDHLVEVITVHLVRQVAADHRE